MSLPMIYGVNPNKESQFYEKLCSNVQALETMAKLGEVIGYVRMPLNKLEGIRGDLINSENRQQLARMEIRPAFQGIARVDREEPAEA